MCSRSTSLLYILNDIMMTLLVSVLFSSLLLISSSTFFLVYSRQGCVRLFPLRIFFFSLVKRDKQNNKKRNQVLFWFGFLYKALYDYYYIVYYSITGSLPAPFFKIIIIIIWKIFKKKRQMITPEIVYIAWVSTHTTFVPLFKKRK